VESPAVRIFMPQDAGDLSIYKQMLAMGRIKPYEMPEQMGKLAERVMDLMEIAQSTGRIREAMKAAEILRMLAADNRALAVELDRIERLDQGKPTAISGQVDPETQARIKRIVSTQRASRTNTEASDVRGESEQARDGGDDRHRIGGAAEGRGGGGAGQGDHQAAQDARVSGAEDRAAGKDGGE
jgi:hypothetical protein